jgi:hypothetical protein
LAIRLLILLGTEARLVGKADLSFFEKIPKIFSQIGHPAAINLYRGIIAGA